MTDSWWTFDVDDRTATVEITDLLGGLDAGAELCDRIAAAIADEIVVRVDSPGGDAGIGLAVTAALIGHRARVLTFGGRQVASAATVILLAGDKRRLHRRGVIKLHGASNTVTGDGNPDLDDQLAGYYATRTMPAGTVDDHAARARRVALWRRAMAAEAEFSQLDAVDLGLVDEIGPDADWLGPSPLSADEAEMADMLGAVTALKQVLDGG